MNKLAHIDLIVILMLSGGMLLTLVIARAQLGSSMYSYLNLGRKLSLPLFVGVMVSSWYGMIFGVTQISFEHGIYNFITQGVFWYLAAALFAIFMVDKIIKKQKHLTIPSLIKECYGSSPGLIAAALFILKTLPYQYAVGFAAFLNFFLGVEIGIAAVTCLAVVAIFSYFGGIKTTLVTDFLQFFFMFAAIIMVVIFSYIKFGGLEYLQAHLPTKHFHVKGNHNITAVISWSIVAFSTTFLSPIFFSRTLMAQNNKVAKKGIFLSIIFWFLCDICTTLGGMYAKAYMPDAPSHNAYLMYGVEILPEGLKGLFVFGILATLYSALDTHLLVPTGIIINDILDPKLSDKTKKLVAIALTASLTFLLANYGNYYIEYIMLMVEGLFFGLLLVPYMMALSHHKYNSRAFFLLLILGLACQKIAHFIGFEEFFFFGIFGGVIGFIIVKLRAVGLGSGRGGG